MQAGLVPEIGEAETEQTQCMAQLHRVKRPGDVRIQPQHMNVQLCLITPSEQRGDSQKNRFSLSSDESGIGFCSVFLSFFP